MIYIENSDSTAQIFTNKTFLETEGVNPFNNIY